MASILKDARGGKRAVLAGIISLVLLGISGCATIAPESGVAPAVEGVASLNTTELVKNLAQADRRLRSLRTLATVQYWGMEGRASFQEAILVLRPDRVRLETLSPLGATLIVTVDADEIAGFHTREGLFYRGRSSKENLLRYTHIPLALAELTALLMGLPPVEAPRQWQDGESSIYWETEGGGREKILFHPTLGVALGWERSGGDGEIELKAMFSNFSATPNGLFPLTIALEAPAQKRWLEIRYHEPELNVALPFPLFVQDRPASAREVPLESLGG
jgi:hypothetical protein